MASLSADGLGLFLGLELEHVLVSEHPSTNAPSRAARALLIEESPTIALQLRALLAREGIGVDHCNTSAVADVAISQPSYALALIGATMSNAAELVASCVTATPPVPVISIVAGGGTLVGATTVLPLPPDPVALRDAIAQCLDGTDHGIDRPSIAVQWDADSEPLFRRVVHAFLAELRGRLTRIDAAAAIGDRNEMEHQAHAVKGAAANVGANAIVQTALRIEYAAPARSADELMKLVTSLHEACARGVPELARIVDMGLARS